MENTTESRTLSVRNIRDYSVLVAERLFPASSTVEVTAASHHLVMILASQDLEATQVKSVS
jgi:hypothetical protein